MEQLVRAEAGGEPDAIGLAEKILALLDQGRFTATYKYAVLLAIMELCLERTGSDGSPPQRLSTRDLAEKVIELYWPHTVPYAPADGMEVLRQNQSHQGSQAEIVRAIERFRNASRWGAWAPLARVKMEDRPHFERLIDRVEWKLVEMPLPKLQRFGQRSHRFLYDIGWDDTISHEEVKQFRRGRPSTFDGHIALKPGVGEALVRLNGVLRPVIQRQWALMVAQTNNLPEAHLEQFLFGATRASTDELREPLQQLQQGCCFYCERAFRKRAGWYPEVDHFVPWARYPNNGLANLVAAHERCNNHKRDFLAATEHVEKWLERNDASSGRLRELEAIEKDKQWAIARRETQSVATALYRALPAEAELWRRGNDFELAQPKMLERLFRRHLHHFSIGSQPVHPR